jgi:hypothetical protein
MAVNFANLVLAPCMTVFARVVTIDPVASRPGDLPYTARAIYTTQEFDVQSIDGGLFSDQRTWLGFRFADFTGPPPLARDVITLDDGRRFLIDDVDVDLQGGFKAQLRQVNPDYPT